MGKLIPSIGKLRPFDTRGYLEKRYLSTTFDKPFSGYLGGIHRGGYWVERLSDEWSQAFKVKHAIPCNSATSGLYATCAAVHVGYESIVKTPVYSMSASASCAMMHGGIVDFVDIEPYHFTMDGSKLVPHDRLVAVVVTNLFGHPASLPQIREWCDRHGAFMIEDNAQGIFSSYMGKYSGTFGHMGVFSLNVHKHLQVGEGGVVVTDDDNLALRIKDVINHGELRDGGLMGLNLRMTEPIAAMACAQLSKGRDIVSGRRALAIEMNDMVKDIPFIIPPREHPEAYSSYYLWAPQILNGMRSEFVSELCRRGVPMNAGYSPLLSRIFHEKLNFPVAQGMEDKMLMTFEICSHDPTTRQRKAMRDIFRYAADKVAKGTGDEDWQVRDRTESSANSGGGDFWESRRFSG